MDAELLNWKKRLVDMAKNDTIIDFTVWVNYLAFDIIGHFAFGKSFGFIEQSKDPYDLISTIDTRGEVLNALGTLPACLRPCMKHMYIDPFWSAGLRAASNLAALGRAAYFERRNNPLPRKDLLSYLFAAKDNEDVGEQETIAESISFIVRGSDTTSSTITHFIDFVSRDRALQRNLQKELDTLKEVMRIRPTSSTGLERVVPKGGKRIAGEWFPAGTVVSVPTCGLMSDPRVFKDAAHFFPERWLDTNANELLEHFMPFSTGPRACIGRK
ncbi:hypothetical protein E8E12_006792 [Didymella heteroderae]|uniref:Uncharacterized protein n=1 Tax=Didymella heteroderae TaxID=1769908 RepID=A0A9P4WRH2_9PLEO|nr:hypothetical protein E8E12_006792 [Didymella heteroderae]